MDLLEKEFKSKILNMLKEEKKDWRLLMNNSTPGKTSFKNKGKLRHFQIFNIVKSSSSGVVLQEIPNEVF